MWGFQDFIESWNCNSVNSTGSLCWKIGTWHGRFSLRKVSTPWFASVVSAWVQRCYALLCQGGASPYVSTGSLARVLSSGDKSETGWVHTREWQGLVNPSGHVPSKGGSSYSAILGGTEPRVAIRSGFQEKPGIQICHEVSWFLNLGILNAVGQTK